MRVVNDKWEGVNGTEEVRNRGRQRRGREGRKREEYMYIWKAEKGEIDKWSLRYVQYMTFNSS